MNSLAITARRKPRGISLTPLIDVVFILLLFFMLSSSFYDWRFVDWPATPATESTSTVASTPPAFLLLHKTGELTLWPGQNSWPGAEHIQSTDIDDMLPEKGAAILLIPEEQTRLQIMLSAFEHLKSLGAVVELTDPVEKHDFAN